MGNKFYKVKHLIIFIGLLGIINIPAHAIFSKKNYVINNNFYTGSISLPETAITNQDLISNSRNLTIYYTIDFDYSLDYVQLCYSYNLSPFICPDEDKYKSVNNTFNLDLTKDGIYTFYTLAHVKGGRIENNNNLDEKKYTIQIDASPPTTNLNINEIPENNWSGQNLLKNEWNIDTSVGDHHFVEDDVFLLGFKDSPLSEEQEDSISQKFFVPPNSTPNLAFWYRLISQDISEYDKFQVQIKDAANNQVLENILTTGNQDPAQTLDTDWQYLTKSLQNYQNNNINLCFSVSNTSTDSSKRTWAYLRDIKVSTLDFRVGETFVPQITAEDIGSGILDSTTLPEILIGENNLTFNSSDIADNIEKTQSSTIVVLPNITINKFDSISSDSDHEWVELFNNLENPNDGSEGLNVNNWKICDEIGGLHCVLLEAVIPYRSSVKFTSRFYLNNDTDTIKLFDNQDNLIDEFKYLKATGIWQRTPDGIGTWNLITPNMDFNLIYRPEANKITLSVFNIPEDNFPNYEILYSSNSELKGIAGVITKETIESNKSDRDFYLGTCSTGGACTPDLDIGTSIVVNISHTSRKFIIK